MTAVSRRGVKPLRRVSEIYPPPTINAHGKPVDWAPNDVIMRELGWYEVHVGGENVTWLRDVQVLVHGWTRTQPFGCAVADIEWPQVTGHEPLGSSDLRMFKAGANVDVRIVNSRGHRHQVFEGLITAEDLNNSGTEGTDKLRLTITGALYQADLAKELPAIVAVDSVDAGHKIANLLNGVVSRNYATTRRVKTAIPNLRKGSGQDLLTGAVQDILSTMTTHDGDNAWTVDCRDHRRPVVRKKDMTTVHWTMRWGQRGLQGSLRHDWTQFPTTIYGMGTAVNGFSWRNSKFPFLHPDAAPIFPLSGGAYHPGGSTAGFKPFAQRMRLHGYPMYSSTTYSSRDEDEVRKVQERGGLSVDGLVGPQTWNFVFDVGANSGSLRGAHIAPLAGLMSVEPRLEGADGHDRGHNPHFVPGKLRVERFENMGEGISKHQGLRSARAELNRDHDVCWIGTLTLTMDPNEGSRRLIREGHNIRIRGLRGETVLFHISSVTINEDVVPAQTQLTVSERSHDLMTIASMLSRNKDNSDPARRPQNGRRSSRVTNDTVIPYDGENGGGVVPDLRLYGGLWTVIRIPLGEEVDVVKTLFKTRDPHCIFAVGIFRKHVTPEFLRTHVGDPLQTIASWTQGSVSLRKMGWVVSWGDKSQPGGYSPKTKSTPHSPITGELIDEAGWHFSSDRDHTPWCYVAMFAPVSCTIHGRLFVAPQ